MRSMLEIENDTAEEGVIEESVERAQTLPCCFGRGRGSLIESKEVEGEDEPRRPYHYNVEHKITRRERSKISR